MNDSPRLHVVLYQPEIPPNTGNVGRSCVAAGAKLWLVRPLGFNLSDKQVRRAGLDYWPHLDLEVVDDWDALLEKIPLKRMWFYSKKAEQLYCDVRFQEGDVLVFGSETRGLPSSLLEENSPRTLRIPIRSQVRSLNLASAVAVGAFEALRQFRS